jgi:fatty acid desaturase
MRHHIVNADPVAFDYRGLLKRKLWLERLVFALEWAYIPAVEMLMHAMLLLAPFYFPEKSAQRSRLLGVIAVRGALLLLLLWWSPRAVLGYAMAYLLLLTVLRFMDAFQHNYELSLDLENPNAVFPHKGDRHYEQGNTYSNLISQRWPWLNLLVLNFCYHNAHHEKPTLAWHRLPELHRQMCAGSAQQLTIGFAQQLRSYHRNRLVRIYSDNYGNTEVRQALADGTAVGANGLNFLTAF